MIEVSGLASYENASHTTMVCCSYIQGVVQRIAFECFIPKSKPQIYTRERSCKPHLFIYPR
jgi:hypothetical protein